MRIVTGSPELADVAGAVRCSVDISDCPAGMCFTTQFFDADGKQIRQDQHIDAFRAFDGLKGEASLYKPPA